MDIVSYWERKKPILHPSSVFISVYQSFYIYYSKNLMLDRWQEKLALIKLPQLEIYPLKPKLYQKKNHTKK